ncbi:hypothetical protein KAR91_70480 [Candidatus Pacearchaeota archaeon]|nr:hypothetical protein [Candidatus Pacearchaeota archaeon]
MENTIINSLQDFTTGTKCSILIEKNGQFFRRNGIVGSEIKHRPGYWCIEMTQREDDEKYFNAVNSDYFEILEPMDHFKKLENAFDELVYL